MSAIDKPAVFIGSSAEGLPVAEAIQLGLETAAEVTIWSQGVFGLSQGTLEELVRKASDFDFAILVMTPDDLTERRGRAGNTPRDNVVFELGLFMGTLGRDRTFVVHPRDQQLEKPSDLAGVTCGTYESRRRENLVAALGPACTELKMAMRRAGLRRLPSLFLEFFGKSAASRDFKLVFSKRELTDTGSFHYPFAKDIPFPLATLSPSGDYQHPSPKDVKSWLAYDDLLVATKLGRLLGRPVQVSLDTPDDTWPETPTVAVGLGFTWHTRKLLVAGRLSEKVVITWTVDPPVTDAIVFDGEECVTEGRDYDVALVARVVCDSPHIHFICAGRTAPGTAAAGRYLAERWRDMAQLYEGKSMSSVSLAVLIGHPRKFDDVSAIEGGGILRLKHCFGAE